MLVEAARVMNEDAELPYWRCGTKGAPNSIAAFNNGSNTSR